VTVTQTDFRRALLDPAAATPDGLRDAEGRPAGRRFAVYRNNVAVGLSDALETAFPVLRKLLGDAFFRAMAGLYLRAHPPTSPLMMFYGAEMPAFLETFPPVAHLPYLADVARLELVIRHAYHAADATPVAPDALGQIPQDRLGDLTLRFAPAVQLVRSDHPVHAIWAANAANGPKPIPGPQAALVTRPQLDPRPHALTPGAGAILAALITGTPLGEAADAAPDDLGPLLGLLLAEGAIAAVDLPD
jgi:hypothetical protein